MNGKFYTEILERQLPEVCSMLRGRWRLQQDNNPNVLLRNFLIIMSRRLWTGPLIVRT